MRGSSIFQVGILWPDSKLDAPHSCMVEGQYYWTVEFVYGSDTFSRLRRAVTRTSDHLLKKHVASFF
jgi:hypothetical protein